VSALARDVQDAIGRLEAGESGILLTVETTAGSTPRDAGTAMLIFSNDSVGTIGGGALEHGAINRARAALGGQAARLETETVPLGPAIGQCCGGSVVLRYQAQNAGDHMLTGEWLARIDGGDESGVWLFGAGHVGKAVARAIGPLGFPLTWIDSRPDSFPDAPEDASVLVSRGPHLEVANAPSGAMLLVMTHSHAQDFDIVDAALKRVDLRFVGLIGSATKRARFISRLGARGHSEQAIGRLHCPIGIAGITGKEPEIIAASVAAQLLRQREAARSMVSPPVSMTG
jgi:xanthine dehydrogenase accessory factor